MNVLFSAVAGAFTFGFVLRNSEMAHTSPLAIFAPGAVPWLPIVGAYLAVVGFGLLFMACFYPYFSGAERLKSVPAIKCLIAAIFLLAPPLFIYGADNQGLQESQTLGAAHGLIVMCSPWLALALQLS